MATVQLSPLGGAAAQFFDNNGNPLSGGFLYSYVAGTSTPQATYTTYVGNIQHSNPIQLDAAGRVPGGEIWLVSGASYKFVLQTSANVLIATWDNIFGDTAAQIEYIPPFPNAVTSNYTVQDKLSQYVSVKDFGAKGDGVTNDTTAIQYALNSGYAIYFPNGTYKTGALIFPDGTTAFGESEAQVIISPIGSIGSNVLFGLGSNVEIYNFTFADTLVSYPGLVPINASAASNVYVHNVTIGRSLTGITMYNTGNSIIENCVVGHSSYYGIYIRECTAIIIDKCTIGQTDNFHCIQDDVGYKNTISNCTITAGHIFGISSYNSSYTNISNNKIQETRQEAINLENANNCVVKANNCSWTGTTSIDFGISLYGAVPSENTNFNMVTENYIGNCAKSGIALAERCQFNIIANNEIQNVNVLLEPQAAGIFLYGTGCANNLVNGNNVYDGAGQLAQCISDVNADGANDIFNNLVYSTTGAQLALKSNSQQALTVSQQTYYTPTVTADTGTITSYTANGQYMTIGKLVYMTFTVNITNVGTGGGALKVTLPFQAGGNFPQYINGRNETIGYSLNGEIAVSGTQAYVRAYNNSFPVTTGDVVFLSGCYVRV